MAEFVSQPWFWPGVILVFGLPLTLIVLTEIYNALVVRQNPASKIVALLRNFVVPVGALLLLLSQAAYLKVDWNWTRIIATLFGFLVILLLINGFNLAFFETAKRGTWRQRVPSIFVELIRVVLIVVFVAMLFGFVWGADIGGLFTALGVGSIVIGLALQNAVGSVVSGLLLLFEQPFELGDWLEADGVIGQVVEVNWRSVHIETDDGIRIVPNANLAGSSFVNLTKSGVPFGVSALVRFSTDDPPQEVAALCREVARGLPQIKQDEETLVTPQPKGHYIVFLTLNSISDRFSAPRLFKTRLWYAARRAGLAYDKDTTDAFQTEANYQDALARVAPVLRITADQARALRPEVKLERYGQGETVQQFGSISGGMRVITDGVAILSVLSAEGPELEVMELNVLELIGLGTLTRQAATSRITAVTDLAVLLVPHSVLDRLVESNPEFALEVGKEIDRRRAATAAKLSERGLNARPEDHYSS